MADAHHLRAIEEARQHVEAVDLYHDRQLHQYQTSHRHLRSLVQVASQLAGQVGREKNASGDEFVHALSRAWPNDMVTWDQSPLELVDKLIQERDEALARHASS